MTGTKARAIRAAAIVLVTLAGTPAPAAAAGDSNAVARGEYLARAGNCLSCHTTRGEVPFSGGEALATKFGTFYPPNITPDETTGIGRWSPDDFWNALHFGRSRDGRPLYPSFPYPNYTGIRRADADALYVYLRSVKPARRESRTHELNFPYNLRALLPVWRLFFFRAGEYVPNPKRPDTWNRGAYLVTALGHCDGCHGARNFLGGARLDDPFSGALMPLGTWYASPLAFDRGPALDESARNALVAFLKQGASSRGAAYGPMASVVKDSLQYLTDDDLRAIVAYLESPTEKPVRRWEAPPDRFATGRELYEKRCRTCHGALGNGAPPIYPALAGNPRVTATVALNTIRMILVGGFPPATAGNPRPYGMPPYAHEMNDQQVAAVATYVRQSWGNRATAVSADEVARTRGVPAE